MTCSWQKIINDKYIRRIFRVLFSSNLRTEQTDKEEEEDRCTLEYSPLCDLISCVHDAAEEPRPAGAAAGHSAG